MSVLIVNYKSHSYVSRLIDSLPPGLSVVIVDNYSDDSERQHIDGMACQNIRVMHSLNDGFAAGVNAGLSSIDPGQWILLVNPDVIFASGAVEVLFANAIDNDLDLAVPCILQGGSEKVWFSGGRVRGRDLSVVHDGYGKRVINSDAVTATTFVSGCVVLFRPSARSVVLPLEESLFMYYEDVLMSFSANRQGLVSAVVNSSRAYHAAGASSRQNDTGNSSLYYYYQSRNRILAARSISRTMGIRAELMTPYCVLNLVLRIVRRERGSLAKMRAVGIGAWDGLRGKSGRSARRL
ncbi:glycosyltransferase family 2 protein [Rhodococcus sp. NPDC056960]|uniref:glycosyltransferase family 2 protein n=1 Tax=Rhodococcus sp. NPDC056960 TaxID=3345982 RepID=UPI003642F099